MVNRRRPAGYSLTEVMITVAIVAILSSMGARMLVQVNRYFILTRTRMDLQQEARAIMYIITRELRQADVDSIEIDRVNTSQPFYSRLRFAKLNGTTWTFQQNGKTLTQTYGTKSKVLSKNLRYLAFTFPRSDDLSIISVSLTLESTIFEGRSKALHMASEKVQVMNTE